MFSLARISSRISVLVALWIGTVDLVGGFDFSAAEDVWIRDVAPETTYNADFLDVRRTTEVRYGLAQFDLTSLAGERVTGVELVLDELGAADRAGSSADLPVETTAFVIRTEGNPPDLLAMTWSRYQSTFEGSEDGTLSSLGAYELDAPGGNRTNQLTSGTADDVALIQKVIDGSGILTLVLKPTDPGFEIGASFGDGELNGMNAVLRVFVAVASFSGVTTSANESVTFELKDGEDSTVDLDSITLTINSEIVSPTVEKDGLFIRVTLRPDARFSAPSTHSYVLKAIDSRGVDIGQSGEFEIGTPLMPLTGLPGPAGTSSGWGLRQIWIAGTVDGLATALRIAADPKGEVADTFVSTIHHFEPGDPGLGGPIPGDQELPAASEGLTPDDFVIVGHILVGHPGGDLSIGVHTDDGFGLRIAGASFASVHGSGMLDPEFPSIMVHPGNTSDSDTRGIIEALPAGEYPIEFIAWERSGGAFFQLYAALGKFDTDFANPGPWFLIGDPAGPLQPQLGKDSDGDGMSDAYEIANGLDVANNDAQGDLDGDGLTNLQEHQLLTLANTADTDGDGLRDGVETGTGLWESSEATGTDPKRRDSDGDGLVDSVETNTQTLVDDTDTGTNPNLRDSDGDGFDDPAEIRHGSDPSDPSSRSGSIVAMEDVWIRSVSPERTFNADFLDARRTDEVRYGLVQFDLRSLKGEMISEVELVLDELGGEQGAGSSSELPVEIEAFIIGIEGEVPDLLSMNWVRYQAEFEGKEDGALMSLGAYDLDAPGAKPRVQVSKASPEDVALVRRVIEGAGILTLVLKPTDPGHAIATSFGDGELNGKNAELVIRAGLSPRFRIVDFEYDPTERKGMLAWASKPGVRYSVQVSSDLETWRTVGGERLAEGDQMVIALGPDEFESTEPAQFFRVLKLP